MCPSLLEIIMHRNLYILFGVLGIIIIIFIIIIVATSRSMTKQEPTITPTPLQVNGQSVKNTPIPTYLPYNSQQTKKMINLFTTRTPLQASDQNARTQLLNSIGNTSNTVYQTSDFRIDYLQAPNSFQVEIDTANITQAKQEVVAWLKTKGFSQNGICNLPISFYVRFDISQQLRSQNISFDPLAPGC